MVVVIEWDVPVFRLAEAFARLFEAVESPLSLKMSHSMGDWKMPACFDFYDGEYLLIPGLITDKRVMGGVLGEANYEFWLHDPGCFGGLVEFISRVEIGRGECWRLDVADDAGARNG